MGKRRKYSNKTKGRMFIIIIFLFFIIFTLSFTLFNNLKQINDIKKEKNFLISEKEKLLEKQSVLEADIEKLSDNEYIARYAREKYFYSRPGEIVLRIDD